MSCTQDLRQTGRAALPHLLREDEGPMVSGLHLALPLQPLENVVAEAHGDPCRSSGTQHLLSIYLELEGSSHVEDDDGAPVATNRRNSSQL